MALRPVGAKHHPFGYDVEFLEELAHKYRCGICRKALRDPFQTTCGHRYCDQCLLPLLTRHTDPRCPLDGELLVSTEIFRDICCKREILNLKCYCTFKKYGCDWINELRLLEEHVVHCPYEEVVCPNSGCTVKLAKITLEKHATNECLHKKQPCTYCEEPIATAQQEPHFQTCPKFPLECPSGCGITDIPRDALEAHQTNQCTLAELLCLFHTVGCTFKGPREQTKEHEKQYKDEHVRMISKKLIEDSVKAVDVTNTVHKLMEEKAALEVQVSTQNETLATTMQNLRATQSRLSNVEKTVSDQKKELALVRRNVETAGNGDETREHLAAQLSEYGIAIGQHEAKMAAIERDLARAAVHGPPTGPRSLGVGANMMSCERRVDRTEHQLTLHDIQLSEQDLKIKLLDATSYDGSYIWKIDEWRRRLQEAKSGKTPSIYSPPFYVGRFGYKLCARVYPNGDGMGKGSHFSLFFVVMRGEYDALLSWPFSQKVRFRLLDQNGDQHIEDSFRPDPASSSFKLPTSNMNIASGCPLFAAHSTLRTRGYVKDDIVFVRIDIDKAGLPPVCL